MRSRLIAIVSAVLLVGVSLPFYLTFTGLSLMAFDAPDPDWRPWLFVGIIAGISFFVPLLSLIGSILFIRKDNFWAGIGVSLIPLGVLAGFMAWANVSSFGG